MLKGNKKYPRTITSAYNILTHFEFASPRRYHTESTGEKRNMENCGGHGGRDHTFSQHTAPSGTVFISVLDGSTSSKIKCFNCERWGHYENQCPELMQVETPNKSVQNLSQIGRCLARGSSGGAERNNWILLEPYSTIIRAKKN